MRLISASLFMLTTLALNARGLAQDLEPRVYAVSPVGVTFLSVGFARSNGDITFDPTLPITNVKATLYAPVIGVSRTFGLLHRQTLFSAALPYVWGNVTGDVGDRSGKVYRSGLGDLRLRYSVNLHGAPAMTMKEFAHRHREYILAASLTTQAPAGQYGNTKLVNIGTNRWSFKPEIGFSYPVKKLDLDLYAAAWLFTDNSSYYPGNANRTQEPLPSVQAHLSYTTRHGLWVAFDSTWYSGGAVSVNNGPFKSRQSNSRLGGTVSIPLPSNQSIKVAYSSGVSGTIGVDFSTLTIGWQKTLLP